MSAFGGKADIENSLTKSIWKQGIYQKSMGPALREIAHMVFSTQTVEAWNAEVRREASAKEQAATPAEHRRKLRVVG